MCSAYSTDIFADDERPVGRVSGIAERLSIHSRPE
jgi:hypothetical protein